MIPIFTSRMNETMKESSSIRDARSDDEATMQATNRGTSLGLAIFSMYSLAAGSIALEQSRSGVLVNVNEALIALLISKCLIFDNLERKRSKI